MHEAYNCYFNGGMICPECSHDMFDDCNCIECGFQGVGLCTKAWSRMCLMYYRDTDWQSLDQLMNEGRKKPEVV
jgi:hypothetical protein